MSQQENLDERELLRRAMVNTMRLFSADQLGSDAELFRSTVMQTLAIVRQRQHEDGLEIGESLAIAILGLLHLSSEFRPLPQEAHTTLCTPDSYCDSQMGSVRVLS